MTDISVIIPTHNQKERLRLVLCGLSVQTVGLDRFEVVVVDDGCTDGTLEMVAEAPVPNLRVVRAPAHVGRSQARNLGIEAASGSLLVFLDGDALPAPDCLEKYWGAYCSYGAHTVLCGCQHVLQEVEYLEDPQSTVRFTDSTSSVIKDWIICHREEVLVREEDVRTAAAALMKRARPGGYPFPDSEQRQEQTRALLAARKPEGMAWVGFVPHNAAVGRELVANSGGFDTAIPFSEGWELAYRLQNRHGGVLRSVGADSIHLYHHHSFSEPVGAQDEAMKRYRAVEYMASKHHDAGVRLLYFWFAALWPDPYIPEEAAMPDLVYCDRVYRTWTAADQHQYQVILDHHPIIGHVAKAGGTI